MREEILRLVRHIIPVAAAYAVSAGWLPEAAQADAVEAAIIVASLGFSLVWSKKREPKQ